MNFKLWITAGDGGDRQEERLRLRVGVLNSELGVRNLKLAGSGWGQLRKVKAKIEAREFITQNSELQTTVCPNLGLSLNLNLPLQQPDSASYHRCSMGTYDRPCSPE